MPSPSPYTMANCRRVWKCIENKNTNNICIYITTVSELKWKGEPNLGQNGSPNFRSAHNKLGDFE
jgi:hypothetical protein